MSTFDIAEIRFNEITWAEVTVQIAQYGNGTPAMQLYVGDGYGGFEELATASVNMPHDLPADGCIWVKNWSENAGIEQALVSADVIELTGRHTYSGYISANEARVLPPYDAMMVF